MAEGTAALWLDYPPTGFIDAGVLFPGGGWITARELFVVGDTEMSQCLGTDNRGYGVLMYVLSLRPSLSTAGILCFLYSFFSFYFHIGGLHRVEKPKRMHVFYGSLRLNTARKGYRISFYVYRR